jgi:tetratricopeptide (TPR) repeat protein
VTDRDERDFDRTAELAARRTRVTALLAAGDVAAADHEISAYAELADALDEPRHQWQVPLWRGARAFTLGRVAEAGALGRSAAALGAAAGSEEAIVATFVLRYHALVEAGEIGPVLTLFDHDAPAGFQRPRTADELGLAALHHCIAGRPEEARALLDRAADALADLPAGGARPAPLVVAAEVIWRIGGHPSAQWIHDALLPHAAAWAVEPGGAFVHGCVARPLGLLALLLDDRDEAVAHFEAALEAHGRADAPMLVARTLRDWGVAAADRARLLEAFEAYRRLEAVAMVAQLATLLRAIGAGWLLDEAEEDGSPLEAAGGLFRRDGEEWILTFGGRVARVRDSNGIRDLVHLAEHPGRAIRAEDLTAESAVASTATGVLRAVGGAADTPDPRAAVAARIKSALRRIESVHPELGGHLARAVRTGATCSYDP